MTLPQQDGRIPLSAKITEALRSSLPTNKNVDRDKSGNATESSSGILAAMEEKRKNQELVSWVESEFAKCKNARSPYERQWQLNLAFYSGKHYMAPVTVPGQGFKLAVPKAPPWRVRLVINKIRTAVRTECSKLTSSRPIPTVMPSTGEEVDFAAAKIGEGLLQSAFSHASYQRTYRSAVWWASTTGNGFMKSYWDANAEDDTLMQPATPVLGADGAPLIGPTGEPIMEQKPLKGKICIERITPFHLYFPDLLSEDINEQPYIIHVMTRSPEWVKRTFGFKPTADAKATNTVMESTVFMAKNSEEVLDSVIVKEVWLKKYAHPDFPEGGLVTIINGQVRQKLSKWPWPFNEFPFYKFDGIPTGSFYSDSIVVDLIPLNKEYNKTKSQMVEIKNTMGKPKLLAQQGSVNVRQISSEPGQAIIYKAGYPAPQVLPAAEVPVSMGIELDRLTQDFDDISGQHEISRAGTPPQVTSGTAIAFLQEQDDTKLGYQVSSIEGATEMLGKHYLKYVSTYWKDERLIRITGKDNEFEAKMFKASDLRGNTDVRIQTGSALPTSKAAKQAMVTEFMQNGWIEPTIGMEILDMGGFQRVMNELLVDKKQAQRENLKMAANNPELVAELHTPPVDENGQPLMDENGGSIDAEGNPWKPKSSLTVNSWDDHTQHIMYHNMFRKSQEFELLEEAIKKDFELHVQTHQLALVSPQEGALGTIMNDPNAPVKDPATGMLVPNPLAQQEEQIDPAAESLGEQEVARGDQEMSNKQEAHELAMEAAQQKTVRESERHRLDLAIKAEKQELARRAMINKQRAGG